MTIVERGTEKKRRLVTSYHETVGDKITYLIKKGDKHGKEQQTLKSKIFLASNPQPQNVAELHRFYGINTLK